MNQFRLPDFVGPRATDGTFSLLIGDSRAAPLGDCNETLAISDSVIRRYLKFYMQNKNDDIILSKFNARQQ